MKKTLKFLLIGLILLAISITMVGCGKDDDEDDDEKSNKSKTENIVNDVEDNVNKVKENINKLSNTTVIDNNTDVNGTASTEGSWSGNIYRNEFLGLKFTMPSSWDKVDDSELSDLMGMMAQDQTTGDNAIVQFEEVPAGTTEQLIYDNLKTGLESVTEMQYTVGDLKTETLAGKTYKTVTASVSYSGVNMVQKYYLYVNGTKAGYIIITVLDQSRLDKIISYFSAY